MEFELTTRFSSPAELFAFASALHGHTSGASALESMFKGDLAALPAPVQPQQPIYAEATPVQPSPAAYEPAVQYQPYIQPGPQTAYVTAPVYAPQPAPAPVQQPVQTFPPADLAAIKQTVTRLLGDKTNGFTPGAIPAWAHSKGIALKSVMDIPPALYGEFLHWLQSAGWRR